MGDQLTLAPFPLFISARDWAELSALARNLAAETLAAERELLPESRLHEHLGLPPTLLTLFARSHIVRETPSFSRTLRFDFHPTRDGWRVSEVNSDVPGGFAEAESFTALMAEHYSESRVPGAPAFSRLLPETRALSEAPWLRDDGWLLKAAYSNSGDSVVARAWVDKARWAGTAALALMRPRSWVAQRRFEIERVETPEGALAPCVGVYVIDGEVAGAYLRLSKGRLIDCSAMDAALLITDRK